MTADVTLPDGGKSFLKLFGPALTAILGLSLWVQLASFAFTEAAAVSGVGRAAAVALPLTALGGGIARRVPWALLAVFPMTLLPPLLLTPDGSAASFADPWSAGRVCASFALYLGLASGWLSAISSAAEVRPATEGPRLGAAVRRHVYPRIVPLLLWWAVPTYAIFWDPAIVGAFSHTFSEGALVAQLFASIVVFFAWAVVAYMWFIVPSLNLEYDRRRLLRDAERLRTAEPRTILRRLGITILVAATVSGGLLLVV